MNSLETSDTCLLLDQHLPDSSPSAGGTSSEDRLPFDDLVSDGRAELLDGLLRLLLAVCLLGSFILCGLESGAERGGSPVEANHVRHVVTALVAKPVIEGIVGASQAATVRQAAGALTSTPRFF